VRPVEHPTGRPGRALGCGPVRPPAGWSRTRRRSRSGPARVSTSPGRSRTRPRVGGLRRQPAGSGGRWGGPRVRTSGESTWQDETGATRGCLARPTAERSVARTRRGSAARCSPRPSATSSWPCSAHASAPRPAPASRPVALLVREERSRIQSAELSEGRRAEALKRIDRLATVLARTAARDSSLLALLTDDAELLNGTAATLRELRLARAGGARARAGSRAGWSGLALPAAGAPGRAPLGDLPAAGQPFLEPDFSAPLPRRPGHGSWRPGSC
jgi:hypothetical protein